MNFPVEDITPLIYALIILMAGLTAWLIILDRKLKRFLRGKNGQSLEEVILDVLEENKTMNERHDKILELLGVFRDKLNTGIRHIKTVRYDYGENSGMQSSVTIYCDDMGNGVIISSLQTRNGTKLFPKPIQGFQCELRLSDEERRLIKSVSETVRPL